MDKHTDLIVRRKDSVNQVRFSKEVTGSVTSTAAFGLRLNKNPS